jgi:hypothetical protein
MAKDRPIPYLRRGRFAGHSYDPETGRIMVRVEWPNQEEEPAPWQPTPRQGVILAIVKRHYRRDVPAGVSIAALHRLVAQKWEAECARQNLIDPQFKLVPGRDTVARTLRLASLIQ